jgi:hypothetical protein
MPIDPAEEIGIPRDEWLESQCRLVAAAGHELAVVVGQVSVRADPGRAGQTGRRRTLTEALFGRAETACKTLREIQSSVQNALFDCEHELRELRERDISPLELLVDGERLIIQYRFHRRRARVIDGLLAYLPVVNSHARACLECLHRFRDGEDAPSPVVPDCGFALVALEQLSEDEPHRK